MKFHTLSSSDSNVVKILAVLGGYGHTGMSSESDKTKLQVVKRGVNNCHKTLAGPGSIFKFSFDLENKERWEITMN